MQPLRALVRGNDPAFLAAATLGAALLGALYVVSAYAVDPVALPALAVAAAFAVLALTRPAWGVAGALAAAPLEIFQVTLGPGQVTPTEAAFAIVALGYLGRLVIAPETVAVPDLRDAPLGLLLAAMAVGIPEAPEPGAVLRVTAFWFLFMCVYFQALSLTRAEIVTALKAFGAAAGILGAIGAVRYLQSGGGGLLGGGTITLNRAVGAFEDANYFAAFLILGLLPGAALALADVRRNGWLLGAVAAGGAGIAFSLSRGGMAGFLVGFLVLLMWRRARWIAFGLAAVFALTTLANANPIVRSSQFQVVEERLSTLNPALGQTTTRPRIWRTGLEVTLDHPLFGAGANQFRHEASRRNLLERGKPLENAHSVPVNTLAELGLIGFAALAAFVLQLASRAARALRGAVTGVEYAVPLGIAAAFTGFALQSLTVTPTRVTVVTGALFALAGFLTAFADRAGEGGEAEAEPAAEPAAEQPAAA